MDMISEEQVMKALSQVIDPDLGKDIVTLKMVKDVKTTEKTVSFTVVLTTPACPLKELIRNACINAIHHLIDKDVEVSVRMSSRVTSNRKDNKQLLSQVRNIIAVASGKGGVGKSTVAANLALSLAKEGASVGLMDADIYGPSVPIMFGVRGERPMMTKVNGKGMIVPLERYGIKLMSIGLLVDERQAIVWRGPMASSALKQFVTEVQWGELDYLVIDLPPGTGDIHLTLVQTIPVTGVVVVTTPQQVALADAKKGIAMFSTGAIKVPVLGLVENMAYFTPADNAEKRYYIFGKDGGKKLAEEFEIPLLGQIPLVEGICEGGDLGIPVMMGDDEITMAAFSEFAQNAARQIAIRNANMAPTQVVEMAR
jgi:ATP-binding protein involved in chromosome partitioning